MTDPAEELRNFEPTHDFFIGVDSDGCVFDSMEIKHKECFTPMFIKHFGLQAVSKYAREVWEFVNLYSKSRGANRFPALELALNLLRDRPETTTRNVAVPHIPSLTEWMQRETKLGNATLAAEVDGGNTGLVPVKKWSDAVNASVADIVFGVPPFPLVRQCLERMRSQADVIVVSQTPTEALQREWREHEIDHFVALIAGQELGTKTQHIDLVATGKYAPDHMLMIGDAPGDLAAAKANGALFYPVNPGAEESCWQQLHGEALDRFFEGTFEGRYEAELIAEFERTLPENPPWE